ncbi:MAG: polysaccharide deacetylase [Promethearchaeota archaeon]
MNGAISVCLTFDFDAEAVQIRQQEEPCRISKGQFAVRRGIPRILSLLKQHQLYATFFVCGWVAEKYPDLVKEIVSNGHEIAGHGYLHENFDSLSIYEEKIIIEKMIHSLGKFTDNIKGFRAPYWKLSSNTLRLLVNEGIVYDSSLFDDDRPYILQLPGTTRKLVEFPVEWFLDDWIIFEEHQHSPSAALEIWKSQFEAFKEATDIPQNRRIFSLTFHPACIGHVYRIQVLEQLISHMKNSQSVFSRMNDIAETILNE